MKVPHPIPYQGSKRNLAPTILRYFPAAVPRLIEPFAGAAAVSLAAALQDRTDTFILNDLNAPLMELWRCIVESPDRIAAQYETLWKTQLGRERCYYDTIRMRFNETKGPHYLLYLLARCVKASVRYNARGEFNQSPDNRRKGMHPTTMREHILAASRLLQGKTELLSRDYRDVLVDVGMDDLVYMDPPYQGVSGARDARYLRGVRFGDFCAALRTLNERRISYIVSYDGKCGPHVYGEPLPSDLWLTRIEIDAGRSSQATLLGLSHTTIESVYISAALAERIGDVSKITLTARPKQLRLLASCETT